MKVLWWKQKNFFKTFTICFRNSQWWRRIYDIKEYLNDFEVIEINIEDTKNIFLYKRFGAGPHLCFAGHIDVVPLVMVGKVNLLNLL